VTVAEQFGANLRRHRRIARLSQEQTAVRASLHRTEVGLLENGRRVPRIDTVMKLAAALEIGVASLMEGIEWLPGEVRRGQFWG